MNSVARWDLTNRWWQHWRKFTTRLQTEKLNDEDRKAVERSAALAQAEYIMSIALEKGGR